MHVLSLFIELTLSHRHRCSVLFLSPQRLNPLEYICVFFFLFLSFQCSQHTPNKQYFLDSGWAFVGVFSLVVFCPIHLKYRNACIKRVTQTYRSRFSQFFFLTWKCFWLPHAMWGVRVYGCFLVRAIKTWRYIFWSIWHNFFTEKYVYHIVWSVVDIYSTQNRMQKNKHRLGK